MTINGAGLFTGDRRLDVFRRFAGRCAYCECDLSMRFHMEHVEPMSKGGMDDPTNIVPACASCNTSKGDLFLLEWVFKRAGLVVQDRRTRRPVVANPLRRWQQYPHFLALPESGL